MTFAEELTVLLNKHSQENPSNTPDFILADFLAGCLQAWNKSVSIREQWYGRDATPGTLGGLVKNELPA